jgi:hypothetical protein
LAPAEAEDQQRRILDALPSPAERKRAGGRKGGKTPRRKKPGAAAAEACESSASSNGQAHRPEEQAATGTGYSAKSLAKVAKVRAAWEKEPGKYQAL